MITAMHQPNFAPWIGFWIKYLLCDTFVFLNDSQFSSGSFINRAKLDLLGTNKWMTVPVVKRSNISISEVLIADREYKKKFSDILLNQYKKSPHLSTVLDLIPAGKKYLMELNIEVFWNIIRLLGLPERKILYSSSLDHVGRKNEYLISILQNIKSQEYLSGDGSGNYLDFEKFKKNEIQIDFVNFEARKRKVVNSQVKPELSILDSVLKNGVDQTNEYIQKLTMTKL